MRGKIFLQGTHFPSRAVVAVCSVQRAINLPTLEVIDVTPNVRVINCVVAEHSRGTSDLEVLPAEPLARYNLSGGMCLCLRDYLSPFFPASLSALQMKPRGISFQIGNG
jgi:hypothetical protein